MYVKKSWNTQRENKKVYYHIAESYRNEEGKPRQRLLLNISHLPKELIELIDRHLKGETLVGVGELDYSNGDSLRGAGSLAMYKLWNDFGIDRVLKGLAATERKSVFAMVWQRVFSPSSKLGLKDRFENIVFSRVYSKNRVDEDELYSVMDKLAKDFYGIQERIIDKHDLKESLILYDTTSTYFEGRKAEGGEYGHSKDHRSDRYQIVIGLVCNEEGIPISVEVWPGGTLDKETVKKQVKMLKERFGLKKIIFVGDKGMYTAANIEEIMDHGFDYILSTEWHTQKKQLMENAPKMRELFDHYGVVEWFEEGRRYIGCDSTSGRQRERSRRKQGMIESNRELRYLQRTASRGKYYTQSSLAVKINKICERYGVKDLWEISFKPIDEPEGMDEKSRFKIELSVDKEAVRKRKAIEGRYVLETSVSPGDMKAEDIVKSYKELKKVEKAFKDIKSFLEIRPVYHWKERRIRAHVLICFLSYYIVRRARKSFRDKGYEKEVVKVLKDWEKLELCEKKLRISKETITGWNWTMGKAGKRIREEIKGMGWWRSIQAYMRSLTNRIDEPA